MSEMVSSLNEETGLQREVGVPQEDLAKGRAMMLLSEADLGYMAGFIDADGSLFLRLYHSGYQRKHPNAQNFMPQLDVANTDEQVIRWFKSTFGSGTVINYKNAPNCRTAYRLQITNKMILKEFLTRILPFLKVKRRQAELLLEFTQRHPPKQQKWTTLEDWECFFELRKLHIGRARRHITPDWIAPHTPKSKLDAQSIIETIKNFLKRVQMSQRELAEKTGYNESTISRILTGHNLKPRTIHDISKVVTPLQPLFVGNLDAGGK